MIVVMQDKDTLVAKMINVCKSDLENIGLEITTMNIADVDDHRCGWKARTNFCHSSQCH
ncbi:hypothetical protein DFO77_10168 [Marinilabilia salmonicolor]|jgi:uncharacterized membrane protein YqiK|uniref:Uncharacterized protein n=1 Tax=Marinilabilia salmonicolor TaxID=989 RepID=A0A368VG88_9BACT|nr:hypothetical protein DFO77_10168 [Marinilabilia salmonicolor]